MKTNRNTRVLMTLAFLLMVAGAGCQQGQQHRQVAFRSGMNQSVEALQAGDLKEAKAHVDKVRGHAQDFEEKRLVQSMDELIAGSQSMMDGDVEQAKVAWSSIEDPHLSREVRSKAAAVMNVDVPLVAKNEGGAQ